MWGFTIAQSRRAAPRCFSSSLPLVIAWPLLNCRDQHLEWKAQATCRANYIFPSWFSSAPRELLPPQRKLSNMQLDEHLIGTYPGSWTKHWTLKIKGRMGNSRNGPCLLRALAPMCQSVTPAWVLTTKSKFIHCERKVMNGTTRSPKN